MLKPATTRILIPILTTLSKEDECIYYAYSEGAPVWPAAGFKGEEKLQTMTEMPV